MNLKNKFLQNSNLAKAVLQIVPPRILQKLGERNSYKTFKNACKLRAYRHFLESNNINPSNIKDFKDIPITDKNNYIVRYNLRDISYPSSRFLFYRSSGYSGKALYWTQSREEYREFSTYVQFNLNTVFNANKKKTLLISTYALSSWITGQQAYNAFSDYALKYDHVTLFACGMAIDEAFETLKIYSSQYEQIIIFGYPLSLKNLIDIGNQSNFNWKKNKIYFVLGAEGITYKLYKYFNETLAINPKKDFHVYSAYGAADTGIALGAEIKSNIIIREIFYKNPKLREALTGIDEMPLHIFQFNPLDNYIEEIGNELIITKDKLIPLVRYNLHDKAKVIQVKELISIFNDFGIHLKKEIKERDAYFLNLPFLCIYGRSDDTIILNGANISINSFKEALNHQDIIHYHTGKFRVGTFEQSDLFINYYVDVELKQNIKPTKKLAELFKKTITSFLIKHDKGYASAYNLPFRNRKICEIRFTLFKDEKLKHKYIS